MFRGDSCDFVDRAICDRKTIHEFTRNATNTTCSELPEACRTPDARHSSERSVMNWLMDQQKREQAAATEAPASRRRARLHEVIFESNTAAGRLFDLVLIWLILLSVATVILESVRSVRQQYGELLSALEWLFTGLFTLEYALRLMSVRRPLRYARSFFGVVDLLAIIPTYLSIFVPGSQYLLVIRILRLLRVSVS